MPARSWCLFLFVICCSTCKLNCAAPGSRAQGDLGLLCATLVRLFVLLATADRRRRSAVAPAGYGSIEMLARRFFSDYLVAFEITSVLLIAAIVGAIALARRTPAPANRRGADAAASGRQPSEGT